jgi:phosphoglycerol transferase
MLGAMLSVGLWDQTSPKDRPDWAKIKKETHTDAAFVGSIEATLPRGSAVFQLPYVAFPENPPIERTEGYDPLKMYLHSKELRWSAGVFRGSSEATRTLLTSRKPADEMVPKLKSQGFSGIVVDRWGYRDNAAQLRESLAAALGGQQPIVSEDGRYVFYRIKR